MAAAAVALAGPQPGGQRDPIDPAPGSHVRLFNRSVLAGTVGDGDRVSCVVACCGGSARARELTGAMVGGAVQRFSELILLVKRVGEHVTQLRIVCY
jgi:hypothetical protein